MQVDGIDERYQLVRFDEIDSTNTQAKRLASEGAVEFTAVIAARQTAGRGRRGRAWDSPRGNLYSSIVLRPSCTPLEGAQISFVAALAVSDVARAFAPIGARIACKWPNDVLVNEHKIAGILLESAATGTRLDWLVLGVGINIERHPGLNGTYPSTSLRDLGALADADSVLRVYLGALATWYGRWRAEGFAAVRAAWLGQALGLHGPVAVQQEPAPLIGRFADIDAAGALVIELETGERRVIAAGDVFFGANALAGHDAARH